MPSKIVTIDLDQRSYDIYIGAALLFRMGDFMPDDLAGRAVFIVADEAVKEYAQPVQTVLGEQSPARCEMITIAAGESAKSFTQFETLCDWLLENGAQRDSILIAVGGGVIGDLAGFAAASVMRGITFIQVPTTLLAQVDSSVGGKTGINTRQGKNLLGAFYQPAAVVADIETLKTLPKRELLAGYAEIVKYGLLGDRAFFEWLEENGGAVCDLDAKKLTYAIEKSVKAKAEIVAADEREAGRRALLNLGHTFGHALEAACGYDGRLLHGEAVSIGMVMAFELSAHMDLCTQDDVTRVENHLRAVGLPTRAAEISPRIRKTPAQLLDLMRRDKKVSGGKMNFVLVQDIGYAFVSSNVKESLVLDVLRESLGDQSVTGDEVASEFRANNGGIIGKGAKGLWKSVFSSRSAQ